MSYAQRQTVSVLTVADGSATVYSEPLTGKISLSYVKSDFADGVDFNITLESSGQTVWNESNVNASATRAPRQATHSTAGVAATYDGTVAVLDKIAIAGDRIKFAITSGGDTKSGSFVIVME